MGLDMYLYCEKYTSKYTNKDLNTKLREMFNDIPNSDNLNTIKVFIEIGYWRKANAIHNWFVENIQENEDNCEQWYVSRDSLIKLRENCINTINYVNSIENTEETINEDKILLKTRSGFFFGSTEYGEHYISDLKDTIEIIDKCLKLDDDYSFYYQSSW